MLTILIVVLTILVDKIAAGDVCTLDSAAGCLCMNDGNPVCISTVPGKGSTTYSLKLARASSSSNYRVMSTFSSTGTTVMCEATSDGYTYLGTNSATCQKIIGFCRPPSTSRCCSKDCSFIGCYKSFTSCELVVFDPNPTSNPTIGHTPDLSLVIPTPPTDPSPTVRFDFAD
jgi:hypothetical protein